MNLGFFTMPIHPPEKDWRLSLREDREAFLLADELGFTEGYVGEHITDRAENITSCIAFIAQRGFGTSAADIQAVVEAEAAPEQGATPGHIDPEARKLIDQVRTASWQEVVLLQEDGKPAYTIYCNGNGSFNYERTLMFGLHEEVNCDGTTLVARLNTTLAISRLASSPIPPSRCELMPKL